MDFIYCYKAYFPYCFLDSDSFNIILVVQQNQYRYLVCFIMAWRVCVVAAIFGTKSKAVNTYRLKQLRVHVVRNPFRIEQK